MHDLCRIESASLEKPLVVGNDFNPSLLQIPVKAGHGLAQYCFCFFNSQPFGNRSDPETELIIFQPSLEIRDQDVEQILLRLVERTEVGPPAHVPDEADARRP